ncbi:MAG: hypothetical protein MJY57_03310 [Bacteroidales bacterium]|nr:hypothetical protein [Bacteroidales bacterium]
MKKIFPIIIAIIFCISCVERRFEPSYPLGVTMKTLNVSKSGGIKHIVVYSNTGWTANMDSTRTWCKLLTTGGSGIGEVAIDFERNRAFERTAKLFITAGDETREIDITQSAGVTDPYVRFSDAALTVNNLAGRDSVWINSNIGDEIAEYGNISIDYLSGDTDWLALEPVVGSEAEDSTYLAFSFKPNTSGEDRSAKVSIKIKVFSGNDIETQCEISQFARPTATFSDAPVLVFAEQVDVPFATNFSKYIDEDHPVVFESVDYVAPYSGWIKSATVDGNLLKLEFEPLSILSDASRSAKVKLSYTDVSETRYDFVYNLTQSPMELDDLSSAGTSNCYIVNKPGYHKFTANVRGNGVIPKDSKYTSAVIEGGASAKILWETVNTASAPETGSIINNIAYSNGLICFNCAGTDGNAGIALLDAEGKILWSWHIWVAIGYQPQEHECSLTTHETYFKPSPVIWMDRNIGALSDGKDKETRPLSLGFFYQNGRKDPMLSSANYVSDHSKVSTSTNFLKTTNYEIWDTSTAAHTEMEAAQCPTTYIDSVGVYSDQLYNYYLWGADKMAPATTGTKCLDIKCVKTLHDPCPVGYQTPASWQIYSLLGGKIQNCSGDGFDVVENDVAKMWFPAGGYRSKAASMAFNKDKEGTGFYHIAVSSKGSSGSRQIHYLGTTSSIKNLSYSNAAPFAGRSVRCVKGNQTFELL